MDPVLALATTAAVVALGGVAAIALRARSGVGRSGDGSSFAPGDLPGLVTLGRNATIVQFSTEFCSRCPATRALVGRIADARDGVAVVEVDLTRDAALASRLSILQTPTVFLLDASGTLVSRFGGAPRADELVGSLERLASPTAPSI